MAQVFKIISRGLATSSPMSAFQHITVVGGGLMGSGIAQVSGMLDNVLNLKGFFALVRSGRLDPAVIIFNNGTVEKKLEARSPPAVVLLHQGGNVGYRTQIAIGRGITNRNNNITVAAQSGQKVVLVDVKEELVKKAEENILTSLKRVAKKLYKDDPSKGEDFVKTSHGNISYSVDLQQSVKSADLVVEAIVENMGAKHSLFSSIDSVAPEHTVFASNTSSLSITEIASVTKRKDRFGGLHFFNPVPVMKLLEVIRTDDTSQETYELMMAWGNSIGKTCITCKDTPGFVVNRLLVPQLGEAVRMVERGVATPRDIDIAMKLGAGHPMGPLELADYTGLDTAKFILDGWHEKFPDVELFKPVETLNKFVSEGKLGRKTGEGFYKYNVNKL